MEIIIFNRGYTILEAWSPVVASQPEVVNTGGTIRSPKPLNFPTRCSGGMSEANRKNGIPPVK